MIISMVQKTLNPARYLRSWKLAIASFIAALTILIGTQNASAQIIDTIAGNGIPGFNGDGLAATASSLNQPKGVAIDAYGRLYIADYLNHRIRRIESDGTMSTFAGTGIAGYSGDGGPAWAAMLNQPGAVAFDMYGNLIIADSQNRRIRKVDSTSMRIITTIAGTGVEGDSGDGGPATLAMLRRPVDLAVDADDNIYFADSVANRIRKISKAGIITTIAGTGAAGFSGDGGPATSAMLDVPVGVELDGFGNIYIADANNHRIRKVRLSDGLIFTIAGNGTVAGPYRGSFSGDDGLASQAGLNFPEGVAVDSTGNFYIADMGNYRVRKVTADNNVITTIAGTGNDGFSGDGGLAAEAMTNHPWTVALDASGNVLIGDDQNNRVRKITFGSGTTPPPTYYFSHLAFGEGYQTTLTYNNYSRKSITCKTSFFSNSGGALIVPFAGGAVSSRTDTLPPGGALHIESNADLKAPVNTGWAQAQCGEPIKASILFRQNQQGVDTGEAGVNAMTAPATKFVTFAETRTGVAYANPSTDEAKVTFTAFNLAGELLGNKVVITLQPGEHGASYLRDMLGISSFTGSIQITSTAPIISLSLNFEASSSMSSLPPGELDGATPLATGTNSIPPPAGPLVFTHPYYFSHLAFGGGYQTTLTYNNYSPRFITCQTSFFSDTGGALIVPFAGGAVPSRTDMLPPGGALHIESNADLKASVNAGWAQAQCSEPIKAGILFRQYQQGVAKAEAGVNAMMMPATKFVTFAETGTGVAYANPSTDEAKVTFIAFNLAGERLGNKVDITLRPGGHGASYLRDLLGISSFTGSVQITSTAPIICLSLNYEASPSMSSLPPGELADATPLATGGL